MPEFDYNSIKKLFHMGERVPADFENPVPSLTEARQIADPAILQQFQTLVKKIIDKDDQEVALLGRRVLEDILSQYPQLQDEASEIYGRYQRLIILLKFMNLAVRGLPEITSLIENHLIATLQAGIPIKNKFQEVLNVYDDVLLSGTISESLTNALSNSSEKLGTIPLSLKGKNQPVPPTLADWLVDYRISTLPSLGSEEQIGTAFDRITYITQSPNAKKLSKDERDVLLRILELYDWLRFGSALLRTGLEEPGAPKYITKQKLIVSHAPPPPPPRPSRTVIAREEVPKQSTPSSSPPYQGGERVGVARDDGREVSREEKKTEELYRSTLEELAKTRAEYEKRRPAPQVPIPPRKFTPPPPPPYQGGETRRGAIRPPQAEYKPFSVSEAIIRGGIPPEENHGEVVPGEKDIEDKLKKLEDKIK